MAIVASVFAMLGRFAGRAVNALLGWATLLLFGRVEARKQTILGFVALASLAWVAAGIGILVPDVGTFVVAAVPRPDFVDEGLVRLGMLDAVVAIPLAVGITGVWLVEARSRPTGGALIRVVLRGYPFTALLAAMIVFLGVVAGLRKIRSLARRWTDAHIPLVMKPGRYDRVIAELEEVLTQSGLDVRRRPAPDALLLPARLLDRVAGRALGSMVPDHLVLLVGPSLEILVYPSDVAISGEKARVARSRAAIASRLTRAPAWMTISAEAQSIEDDIERLARMPSSPARAVGLAAVDRQLASVVIPFDEWETLYRMRLQLGHMDDTAATPDEPIERPGSPREPRVERLFGIGYAAIVVVLLVIDVLVLLTGRRSDRAVRPRRLVDP
jgi:hypothetical protein